VLIDLELRDRLVEIVADLLEHSRQLAAVS
jgi:hypothetical protein